MTTEQTARPKTKERVLMVGIVLFAFAAMVGAGFYQDEIGGFFRMQAWNLRPVTEITQEFVAACAKNDGAKVATLIKTQAQRLTPVNAGGKVTAFMVPEYGGAKKRTLKELAPSESADLTKPEITFVDGGSVRVQAIFRAHLLELTWERTPAGWKLIALGRLDLARGTAGG